MQITVRKVIEMGSNRVEWEVTAHVGDGFFDPAGLSRDLKELLDSASLP